MIDFVTRISVDEDVAAELVEKLNIQLANTIVAQNITKFAHWNVKGEGFFPTHKLFDKIYEEIEGATDRIGERITALGGIAEGLPAQIAENATLSSYNANAFDNVRKHIEAMADMLGELTNGIRALAEAPIEKKDLVTQNLLLELTEYFDKHLYFLEAGLRA